MAHPNKHHDVLYDAVFHVCLQRQLMAKFMALAIIFDLHKKAL
jgi:hypothetical protein